MIGTRLLDRYELCAEVGRGGMGVVYRATDPLLDREVAVKMIPPSLSSRETEARFRREAQAVARMDHPAIVPVYDFGRHEGSLFFVMPLIEGHNLRAILDEGALVLGQILEIGIRVAEALDYSHSCGVIHRDIKPENIMVSRPGEETRVRVMDFGVARGTTSTTFTETGKVRGTLAYLSPEQLADDEAEADERADFYSLGTVLYECLAGAPPFGGSLYALAYRVVHEEAQPLVARGVEIDPELDTIVLGCLAKRPAARPARGRDLAASLERFRDKLESSTSSRSVVLPVQRAPGFQPPRSVLVGRREELAEIQRRLHAALAGECQFVLLGGEAGTGKSRLLLELENLARARRLQVLRGRFSDRESTFPHQGLCELIQDHFRGLEATRTPAARTPAAGTPTAGTPTAESDFSDLAADLVSLFPALAEIPELAAAAGADEPAARRDDPPSGEIPVGGAPQRTYLFEVLARTFVRIAGGQPLVLLVEHLHVETSVDALQYLVRRLGPTPTLLVATYRRGELDRGHPLHQLHDTFRDDPRFSLIVLGPLARDDFRRLVELTVGSSELHTDLVEKLYDATEGNPYFARELVSSLVEAGEIRRDETGTWTLAAEEGLFSTDALPVTIQQAEERKMERLTVELRRVLSVAAVLGRRFEYRDLEALAGDALDLDDAIDTLVRQDILEEDRKVRGDRLAFRSGVVRDLAYRELSRRKRRGLHRRHAELLEKRHAVRLERIYPRLVHHFSQADMAAKTVRYGLALARGSLVAMSPGDAVRAARTALEFVDEDEVEDAATRRGELLETLATAYRAEGNIPRAIQEAGRAATAFIQAGHPGRAAEAAFLAAETAWQRRQVEEVRRWLDRGIELARTWQADDALRRHLTLAATMANLRGEHRLASSFLEQARCLVPPDRDEDVPRGGTLVTVLPSRPTGLDPAELKTAEELEVTANLFETLLTVDAGGHPVPLLCERWEESEDAHGFVFTLRRAATFADGEPLGARDVKASLERALRHADGELATTLAAIEGLAAFRDGKADAVSGIEAADDGGLVIRLAAPLPVFPVLLTDPRTAVAREAAPAAAGRPAVLVGTGPFRLAEELGTVPAASVVLERNPYYSGAGPPRLDRIEYRTDLDAAGIAAGLRSGELDLGRDLLPEDLDEILRDPGFRRGLVESTKKNTYFVLFQVHGPTAGDVDVRRALFGVLRSHDLVWRALGRFALPAVSLMPPGVLGHDPGRRPHTLTRARAIELLHGARLSMPIPIAAAVHPLFHDRYGSIFQALLDEWSALGVEVEVKTPDMESYLDTWTDNTGIDLFLGRWTGNYEDPDTFTHSLFHSRAGRLSHYFSSPEADELLERARQEAAASKREALYRRFERLLGDEHILLPLFHDIDYRIANPRVRGLRLDARVPYVNFTEIGKATGAEGTPQTGEDVLAGPRLGAGKIRLAVPAKLDSLDPISGNFVEHLEVLSNVFETLTRIDEGARAIPWLASSFEVGPSGRDYHFQLRRDVLFHDGRRLTARDVRYTYERVLTSEPGDLHFLLLPIRGAQALREGSATALKGFRILSTNAFVIELEEPLSFFPALLSHAGVAIVPEGTEAFGGQWSHGFAGTGPFRVVRFDRGRRLDLGRHPHYWRPGYPKCDHLVFRLGTAPEKILADFRDGRLSLAADLRPADIEALRRDPKFGGCYKEAPRLSTYFMLFNTHHGVFADAETRLAFARSLDLDELVGSTLGRLVIRAHGLIPPDLLGFEGARSVARPPTGATERLAGLKVKAAVHEGFRGLYAPFWDRLRRGFEEAGVIFDVDFQKASELLRTGRRGSADLAVTRWHADYPDADSFVVGLLCSREGTYGNFIRSPEIDRRIAEARRQTDPELRHTIYHRIEEVIASETLVTPFFHEQIHRFSHPRVRGLRLGFTFPEVRYDELSIDG